MLNDILAAAAIGTIALLGLWFASVCTYEHRASQLRIQSWQPPRHD